MQSVEYIIVDNIDQLTEECDHDVNDDLKNRALVISIMHYIFAIMHYIFAILLQALEEWGRTNSRSRKRKIPAHWKHKL